MELMYHIEKKKKTDNSSIIKDNIHNVILTSLFL